MTAIFEDRGRQYRVKKDDVIAIDKIEKNKDDVLEFEKVLLVSDDADLKIGTPYVSKAKVTAKVIDNVRDDKVIVFKFRRTKNYKRTKGHKQAYTMVKIEEIVS
ncbi:MAG TPA: 50S ribosomal protein L21 [Spirochaetota bacterium]|nr:50S ribosomal protein L21 [Spirochaetota bacterium]